MKDNNSLVQQFEAAKAKMDSKAKTENPDGRITGRQLLEMRNIIEGIRQGRDGEIEKTEGVGDIKCPGFETFKHKIADNLAYIRKQIQVLDSWLPDLPEDLKKAKKEYDKRKYEIAKRNANVPDSHSGAISEAMIRTAGNEDIYRYQIQELEESYKDKLKEINKIADQRSDMLDAPVIKADFDMIHETEIPDRVSANERLALSPMIK